MKNVFKRTSCILITIVMYKNIWCDEMCFLKITNNRQNKRDWNKYHITTFREAVEIKKSNMNAKMKIYGYAKYKTMDQILEWYL